MIHKDVYDSLELSRSFGFNPTLEQVILSFGYDLAKRLGFLNEYTKVRDAK